MEPFKITPAYNEQLHREETVREMLGDIYLKGGDRDDFYGYCTQEIATGLVTYSPVRGIARAVVFRAVDVGEEWGGIAAKGIDELPQCQQTLKDNARGVGLYAASSPRGVEMHARDVGREIGVYLTPNVEQLTFRDITDGNPNSPRTMLRDIFRQRQYAKQANPRDHESKWQAELRVIRQIDEGHQGSDVVLMNPEPIDYVRHIAKRAWQYGFPQYPPVRVLFRNNVALERIGTAYSFND